MTVWGLHLLPQAAYIDRQGVAVHIIPGVVPQLAEDGVPGNNAAGVAYQQAEQAVFRAGQVQGPAVQVGPASQKVDLGVSTLDYLR